MKKDLVTLSLTAIVCAVIGYFISGMFLPSLEDVNIKTLEATGDYSLSEPNVEVFNYKAINPTVEVYVGDCTEYDENGNCLDDAAKDELKDVVEDSIDNTETPQEPEDGSTN